MNSQFSRCCLKMVKGPRSRPRSPTLLIKHDCGKPASRRVHCYDDAPSYKERTRKLPTASDGADLIQAGRAKDFAPKRLRLGADSF
jgi:hypothetical protein